MKSKALEAIAVDLIKILRKKNYQNQGYLKFCIWSKLIKFYFPSIPTKYYVRKVFDIILNKKIFIKSDKKSYNYKFKNYKKYNKTENKGKIVLNFD